MKEPDMYFTLFEKMMDQDKVYLDSSLDFDAICGRLGVSPQTLDVLLYEELGYTGDEILSAYRLNCL